MFSTGTVRRFLEHCPANSFDLIVFVVNGDDRVCCLSAFFNYETKSMLNHRQFQFIQVESFEISTESLSCSNYSITSDILQLIL